MFVGKENGYKALNLPPYVKLLKSIVEKLKLTMREEGSRGLRLTQQPIVLLFASTVCQKQRVKKA